MSSSGGDNNDVFTKWMEHYEAYRELMPLEKLYVHIDQTSYYPGEQMYFSIHALNGMTNQYDSSMSITAYLEIIDNQDSIVNRKALRLESGRAHGTLSLDSLKQNTDYRLRSYTNWMRNFGALAYYEQPFAIIDPDMSAYLEKPKSEPGQTVTSEYINLETSNPDWFQLQLSRPLPKDQELLLIIESQNHIVYSAIMPTKDGKGEAAIQKAKIPGGHFRLAILNADLQVVDQVVSMNDYQHLDYELDVTDVSLEKREKQYGLLTIYDQQGAPIEGEFSVAIRHKEGADIHRWSMQDYFGKRYQNLDKKGVTADIAWLDLSERFNLGKLENYKLMETSMALGGVANRANGKPSVSTVLNMFVNAKVPFYKQTKTNNEGLFVMDNLYFENEADIVLSESKNKALDFTVYPLWPKPAKVDSRSYDLTLQPKTLAESSNIAVNVDDAFKLQADDIILEAIEIEARKEREDIKKGVVRLYGKTEITIDENTVNFNSGIYANVFQIVAGRVSSYIPPPRGGPAGTFARVSSTSSAVPLCLLNGAPTDCASLANIPVQLISSIDVSPKAMAMFGGRGSNGMIAVYTFAAEPNKLMQREINPTAFTFSVEGYHPQDLPEMPDYSIKRLEHVRPDYRRTLFWDPSVPTDDYGSLYLPFYMNDLPDLGYVIEVEGVDNNGRFVSLQVPLSEE